MLVSHGQTDRILRFCYCATPIPNSGCGEREWPHETNSMHISFHIPFHSTFLVLHIAYIHSLQKRLDLQLIVNICAVHAITSKYFICYTTPGTTTVYFLLVFTATYPTASTDAMEGQCGWICLPGVFMHCPRCLGVCTKNGQLCIYAAHLENSHSCICCSG